MSPLLAHMHKPMPRSWKDIQVATEYAQKDFVGKFRNRCHVSTKIFCSDQGNEGCTISIEGSTVGTSMEKHARATSVILRVCFKSQSRYASDSDTSIGRSEKYNVTSCSGTLNALNHSLWRAH